ncbi:MAG: serine hydrolase [Gemmatimonadetes bacterium]|nr:serine hydrolase [Gemmatimonadota bacterium]
MRRATSSEPAPVSASACVAETRERGRSRFRSRFRSAGTHALTTSVLALAILASAASAQKSPLDGLDAYIEQARVAWDVPGVAVAVVKDDSVVFAKGFGVREVGKPDRVDENTLFAIGSSSKAFTAAAVGMLVAEGKLAWDDPATKYLPGFALYDPYVSRELTVRDLLTHRSGLARGDLLWISGLFDRDEILRRARYLEPSWSFRSQFGYQNIMYLAAGQVVAHVSGASWDDVIARRIFQPLGMTSSSTSIKALEGRPNVATPHGEDGGKTITLPYRDVDCIGPAGSINSNVVDMAKWIRFQLGEGSFAGRRLLQPATLEEMWSPQTIIAGGGFQRTSPDAHFIAYGMGWFLHDYHGVKLVEHGGNVDGMTALVALVPEKKLGMVILTNLDHTTLPTAIFYRVVDAYLGRPPRDWSRYFLDLRTEGEKAAAQREQKQLAARVAGTKPSRPIEAYAGTYTQPAYGDVRVDVEDGKLVLRYGPSFTGDLEHWHYNTFRVTWRQPGARVLVGRTFATFALDATGTPATLDLQGFATFARAADAAKAAP